MGSVPVFEFRLDNDLEYGWIPAVDWVSCLCNPVSRPCCLCGKLHQRHCCRLLLFQPHIPASTRQLYCPILSHQPLRRRKPRPAILQSRSLLKPWSIHRLDPCSPRNTLIPFPTGNVPTANFSNEYYACGDHYRACEQRSCEGGADRYERSVGVGGRRRKGSGDGCGFWDRRCGHRHSSSLGTRLSRIGEYIWPSRSAEK